MQSLGARARGVRAYPGFRFFSRKRHSVVVMNNLAKLAILAQRSLGRRRQFKHASARLLNRISWALMHHGDVRNVHLRADRNRDRKLHRRIAGWNLRTSFEPKKEECSLVAEQEPSLGSHVVTPGRSYLHHGIYVGEGRVVHYAGLAHGLRRGPVEEIPLADFTCGRPVWVRFNAPSNFDSREVIRRARSRVGEDRYRLLSNNCEHFCEWCLRDEHRSYQVENWLAHRGRALQAMIRLIAKPFSVPEGIGLGSDELGLDTY